MNAAHRTLTDICRRLRERGADTYTAGEIAAMTSDEALHRAELEQDRLDQLTLAQAEQSAHGTGLRKRRGQPPGDEAAEAVAWEMDRGYGRRRK